MEAGHENPRKVAEGDSGMSEAVDWVRSVKPELMRFLGALREPGIPGFYRYSLTGDLRSPGADWGLANAVFAAKTLYMLEKLEPGEAGTLADFILTFQSQSGHISDPYLRRASRFNRLKYALKTRNLRNLGSEQTMRAESRQSFAALKCLGRRPSRPFLEIPGDVESIRRYVERLDWSRPWAAGSHVSHLLFFLKANAEVPETPGMRPDGISQVLDLLARLKQADGSWYSDGARLPAYEKVNGAMKVLTGLEAAGISDWDGAEQMIDLCLASLNDSHACNHFNITYVLHCASRKTDHRRNEVELYLLKRLELYRKHYWPESGGFSFYERKANDILYNARVTRGLPEPDIHGTVLFVWGIVLISDILGISKELGLRPPIT